MFFPNFESMGVTNFGTYLVGAIFIILLPGPNSLYVLAEEVMVAIVTTG